MEIVRPKNKKRCSRSVANASLNSNQKRKIKEEAKDVLDVIINKANEIYDHLGSGHTETVYHRAMEAELREHSIKYESEVITPIMYKGYYVGYGRADIVVNRTGDKPIVIELKAISSNVFKRNEISRLRTYMNSLNIKQGILVNFPQLPSSSKCVFQYLQID